MLKRLALQQGKWNARKAHRQYWRETQEFEHARKNPAPARILVHNGVPVIPFDPADSEFPDPEL